jgi:hypothetical protein
MLEGGNMSELGKLPNALRVRLALYTDLPNRELADPAIAFFERLSAFTGGALSAYVAPGGDWVQADAAKVVREAQARLGKKKVNGSFTAGSPDGGLSSFEFSYHGMFTDHPPHREQGYLSSLQAWMPVAYFQAHRAGFEQLMADLAALVPLTFAYANLALEGTDRIGNQQLAKRYRAVDIAKVSSVAFDIGSKAAGAFWLTLYGRQLLADLQDSLQHAAAGGLPQGCQMAPGANGTVMLLLGPEPILGDVNRQESVAAYQWLARLLDKAGKLHRPQRVRYFDADEAEGLGDAEAQQRWHERFL